MALLPTYIGEKALDVIGVSGNTSTWMKQSWREPAIPGVQLGDRLFVVVGFIKTKPQVTILAPKGWSLLLNMDAVRIYTKIATSADLNPPATPSQADVVWAYYNPGSGGVQTFLGAFFWMWAIRNAPIIDGNIGKRVVPAVGASSAHSLPNANARYPAYSMQLSGEVAYRFQGAGPSPYGTIGFTNTTVFAHDTFAPTGVWAAVLVQRLLTQAGSVVGGLTKTETSSGWGSNHVALDSYHVFSIVVTAATPPTAALSAPASGEHVDMANYGATFGWQYSSEDGSRQTAYALRINRDGTLLWWDATAQALITTETFNNATGSSVTVPAGVLTNRSYQWSVAVKSEQGLTSAYAADRLIQGDSKPIVTILSPPTVVDNTNRPVMDWIVTDPESQPQQQFELSIVSDSGTGTTPGPYGPTKVWYYSGVSVSPATMLSLPISLANRTDYVVFIRIFNGQWSDWAEVPFRVDLDMPDAPSLRVIPE